ncbi:MAG: ATP-binding cassette domain-containing protein [Fibromonadaceae bacterium]|jgi:ABC-type bacteriocin/lantibiotic exporter with double-glycine peptidase domain|nr:ATP-binding cassette domain-containing protein [Fibromonadaceae bacterium]
MKLSNIKKIFRQNADAVAYVLILNVLLFIPLLLAPIYRKIFTDYVLLDNNTSWLFMLITMMMVTAAFAGVVNWLQQNSLFRLSNKIEISSLNKYMQIMFHSSIKLFVKKDSYTLLSQSEKSGGISKLLTGKILSLLFDAFRVVFYLILMLWINTTLTLIVIALIVANIAFGKISNYLQEKFAAKKSNELNPDDLPMQGEHLYVQGLQNIEIFKSAATESILFKHLLGEKTASINAKRNDDFKDACSPIENLPEILFMNLLLMISAFQIMDRKFSIGTYLEFQAYASAFFYPLNGVLSIRSQLLKFEKNLTGFFKELKDNDEEKNIKRKQASKNKLEGYIEFKNVSFSYEENIPVIKDFNLSVRPKQRIAIIGKSGAGKTTLLKLLQGLYEPTAGEVTIDGISATEIDRELFKNSVGCANQEIAIFSASIRENITMWDEKITDIELYNSTHDTYIHQYISSLDGAYEYQLAENGNNISKGQCQKIEIARALIYNPSIVLFDETMKSVDPTSREHIQKVLLKRGCTCIVVTHLLSQITEYDEIIVLGRAEVIARGKHDYLMNSSPFYKSLFLAETQEQKA